MGDIEEQSVLADGEWAPISSKCIFGGHGKVQVMAVEADLDADAGNLQLLEPRCLAEDVAQPEVTTQLRQHITELHAGIEV